MKRFLFGLLFVCNTSWSCPNPSMTEAAVFDTATTVIGKTSSSLASELNPLGIIGGTLLRVFIVMNEDNLDPNLRATGSAIWMGAGIHNILHVVGVSFAPSMMFGVIAALAIKSNNVCEKGN